MWTTMHGLSGVLHTVSGTFTCLSDWSGMSPDDEPIPARNRQGWSSTARRHAGTQLRTRLNWFTEVVAVAEVGAEYLFELLGARTVTVTTYKDGRYQDLVNVGHLPSGEVRYPKDCMYPETLYPVSTRALHEQGGYITPDTSDPLFLEFYASILGSDATSMMGVSDRLRRCHPRRGLPYSWPRSDGVRPRRFRTRSRPGDHAGKRPACGAAKGCQEVVSGPATDGGCSDGATKNLGPRLVACQLNMGPTTTPRRRSLPTLA
jgi:hypothetical protein